MTRIWYMASLVATREGKHNIEIAHLPFSRLCMNENEMRGMAWEFLMKNYPVNDGWSMHNVVSNVVDRADVEENIRRNKSGA